MDNINNTKYHALFLTTICALSFLMMNDAFATDPGAGGSTSIEKVFCNVLAFIQGGIGRSIAALAIIATGFAMFMGKVSWGLLISVALGIGAIFGAGSIVTKISGGTGSSASSCTNQAS